MTSAQVPQVAKHSSTHQKTRPQQTIKKTTTTPTTPPNPVSDQDFGNEKFGFIQTAQTADGVALQKVIVDFRQQSRLARQAEVSKVLTKPLFDSPKGLPDQQKDRSKAVMVGYPQALKTPDVLDRLSSYQAFSDAYQLTPESPGSGTRFSISLKKPTTDDTGPLGTLLLGKEAFRTSLPTVPTSRKTFQKEGRATGDPGYVADDNGVPTRRYAYVETSRQQLMEALGAPTGGVEPAMRGRYARHRTAMGKDATVTRIDQSDPDLAQLYATTPGNVSKNVMANIHQFLGSGINQRGISLTSTKKEQVYSNDGDSFVSPDGVRITVDLSLVPPTVILLNHYARGGVGSLLAQDSSFPQRLLKKDQGTTSQPRGYNYAASVVKNRELYLSELRPAWITEVRDNLKKTFDKDAPSLVGPAVGGGRSVETLGQDLGVGAYQKGQAAGRTGAPANDKGYKSEFHRQNYLLGHSAGAEERAGRAQAANDIRTFWSGFDADKADREALNKVTPVTAKSVGASCRNWLNQPEANRIRSTVDHWYVLVALRSRKVAGKKYAENMHDSYWLGWAEAAKSVRMPPVPKPTVVAPQKPKSTSQTSKSAQQKPKRISQSPKSAPQTPKSAPSTAPVNAWGPGGIASIVQKKQQ